MVEEAPLERTEHGLVPGGRGWFVVNARDAAWVTKPGRGACCFFEGFEDKADFTQLGVNVTVLAPGEPMAMYHWEANQEDFLVLAGEALAIVEGRERPLRQWDLLHCPAETHHVIVGAGDAPCVVLSVGSRDSSIGGYVVDESARRHGAGVDEATSDPEQAYARVGHRRPARYQDGWLPG
jgi:uncharacterized cupin superfamily protein